MKWTSKTCFRFFTAAAVWNLLAGVINLLDPARHLAMFYTDAAASSGPIMEINTQAFWVTVLLFGWGYLMAARNPQGNRGIILLGAVGKLYVFGLWTWYYMQGITAPFALLGAMGDLIFASFFIHYLLANPVEKT